MAAQSLSKRLIDSIEPDPERDLFRWDSKVAGFGIRVKPSGRKSFLIQYRAGGRTRRLTLAQVGVMTVQEARSQATQRLAEVAQGGDPSAERNQARRAPTMAQLAERYLEQHARARKKSSSAEGDERNLKLHILPRIGPMRVADVTRLDLADLHHALVKTPINANRVLALLSKMFALSILWGIREDNPARGIPRNKENRRERFLSDKEFADLGEALRAAESEAAESLYAIAAIRLLIFTGCRRGEILNLRWEEVDLERRRLWLADTKTGSRVVPLNAPAMSLLDELSRRADRDDGPWVIQGRKAGQPLVGLHRPWARITGHAGLEGVRLHDLRHSHASVGAGAGVSLLLIGSMLGHTTPSTTARYAHLADDPVRQASEIVGGRIADAMSRSPSEGEDQSRAARGQE